MAKSKKEEKSVEIVKYQYEMQKLAKESTPEVLNFKRASFLSQSSIVPDCFKKSAANCFIAVDIANRIGASDLAVMQNMFIVHGKPSFSSSFLISTINTCGRFSQLRYKMTGEKGKDSWGCIAYAEDLQTGEMLEGEEITIGMARAEGWTSKKGSKWLSFPGQMLRYRAAAFWCRAYAPELSMGMTSREEIEDTVEVKVEKVTDDNGINSVEIFESVDGIEEPSFEDIPDEHEQPNDGIDYIDTLYESTKGD